jgi:hypothetical protein
MHKREPIEHPGPGDYYAAERELFRVERIFGDRALIEDCRSEALLDITLRELSRLRRIEPRASAESTTESQSAPVLGRGA